MKKIKIVFENEKDGKTVRSGYVVNKTNMTYVACRFDEKYEPEAVTEHVRINDTNEFRKRMSRLIKYALEEGN